MTYRYWIKIVFLASIMVNIFINDSDAASFNCNLKGLNALENRICNNPQLSLLDDELNKEYRSLTKMLSQDDKQLLKNAQRKWIAERNGCISANIDDCLLSKYNTRIGEMKIYKSEAIATTNLNNHTSTPPIEEDKSTFDTATKWVKSNILQQPTMELSALEKAKPSKIYSSSLSELFSMFSKNTDIQRENAEKEIVGKVVQWRLPIYDVTKQSDNVYVIQTDTETGHVGTFITLYTRNNKENQYIERLITGNTILFKGLITGTTLLRDINIDPAILVK